MFTLPNPLHPVIVHFPIVLLIVGAAAAVASAVLNRWHLPWFAAVLLGLGSIGSLVAAQTGETAEESAGKLATAPDAVLEAHEEWAERTEATAAAAAILAIAAAVVGVLATKAGSMQPRGDESFRTPQTASSLPKAALIIRSLAAITALAACYCVYETGHAGGKLVYDYGVGVKQPGVSATPSKAKRD